jgi:L-Ala-D/L-Glu epimerase
MLSMKIARIECDQLAIRLPRPLTISFHTWVFQDNFFIRIHSSDGLIGWGESAPFKPITGDSADEVEAELKSIDVSRLPPLDSTDQFFDAFVTTLQCPSLRAAIDMAAHDLIARRRGVPVYQLYRPTPRAVPNSVTVFIKETTEQTRDEAARILAKHPHLQLMKIKLQGNQDRQRCAAIKSVATKNLRFVLDANQGFADPREAVAELNAIIDILGDVLAIEEPCPKGRHGDMRYVKERIPRSMILADETCASEKDLEAVIAEKSAAGINLKLQKCGGITPGKRMAARAAAAGLKVMVGGMFEDALGMSAGVHFAVSTDNVIFSDLDMDLDLPTLWTGQAEFVNGCRRPIDRPGFDFGLDIKAIAAADGANVKLRRIL